ncbi:MAG: methyltransferase domain-containing protein [Verrucomicrobiota bacterium]
MTAPLSWQYDEFRQVGRDYGDAAEVGIYDATHADFRDIAAEAGAMLDALGVRADSVLIDFGCGTGEFALHEARRCGRVIAVDVSERMLAAARRKLEQAGLANVEFHHAGFLTYAHAGSPADAIASTFALHHLPDFWKGVALERLHGMLRPGGRFYLRDVVLPEDRPLEKIRAFIEKQAELGGDFLREDAEGHFRDEHSTSAWVMEGLLTRAGFRLERAEQTDGVIATYLCTREG